MRNLSKGKQIKISFKSKNFVSTKRPLELLRINIFGHLQNQTN